MILKKFINLVFLWGPFCEIIATKGQASKHGYIHNTFQSIKKKKGEKHILVPTFSDDSHFSSYILFLPLLIPMLKNAFRFGPYRYIRDGESWRRKRQE